MDITIWKVSQSPRFFSDQENEELYKRKCVCVHPDTSAKGTSSTTQGEDFSNVKNGDFFYLCYGNRRIRLFGMFTGESQESKLAGKSDWLEQKYELYFESCSNNKYQGRSAWWTPSDNSTFTKCKNNEDFQEWILKPFFLKTLKDIEMMTNNEEYLRLLKNNSNLILTGAPGTGKTYLAKQIAQKMIFGEVKGDMTEKEKEQFKKQCGFVQFHPSYDYTDFVEGLRPIKSEKGLGFERKDGVFKEFCKKAIEALGSAEPLSEAIIKTQFDILWNDILNGKIENIPLSGGKDSQRMIVDGKNKGTIHFSQKDNPYEISDGNDVTLNDVCTIIIDNKINTTDALKEAGPNRDNLGVSGNQNNKWAVCKYLLEKNNNKQMPPYVFIIDEINRGEISKIFGELFYSIDPGYRGEKGKVDTQYQNLIPKEGDDNFDPKKADVFREGFYVPENVYIIGTMNDIDRSVESMDFAFRRRFAFQEIKADEKNVEMLNGMKWKDEASNRMINLNNAISAIEGLSSAYHIGASYFLKLKNYDGDFSELWKYHLEGLLREYLRGMQDVEGKIKVLKEAYENENDPDDGQQQ